MTVEQHDKDLLHNQLLDLMQETSPASNSAQGDGDFSSHPPLLEKAKKGLSPIEHDLVGALEALDRSTPAPVDPSPASGEKKTDLLALSPAYTREIAAKALLIANPTEPWNYDDVTLLLRLNGTYEGFSGTHYNAILQALRTADPSEPWTRADIEAYMHRFKTMSLDHIQEYVGTPAAGKNEDRLAEEFNLNGKE